ALLRRKYLGFVFQGFNLLARTSALENVELPLLYRGDAKKARRAAAMAATHPAAFLGLSRDRGAITPGKRADWVQLDAAFHP
ncbi:amidohydrolase family protein, partial [Pseudomonas sp. GP01-A4]|uniref:amidohydrolase family protein n=1 Tax=Pseudomonas sp. GP01-A4 TaxID=2070571 RepID=UPI0011AEE414